MAPTAAAKWFLGLAGQRTAAMHWSNVRLPTRPLSRRGGRWALAALAVLAALPTQGCARDPAQTVAAMELAMRQDDLPALLPLLSERSRHLVEASWRLADRGNNPFRLPKDSPALEIGALTAQSGRMIATVRAGKAQREWVLVQEAGAWRLDVFETALRRPWGP